MSLIKSTATIGGYTMISRVLGFIRDVLIASSIGASALSDAFFVAFKLPNFLRRLFAEGAFSAAFVPLYSGMLAVDGKEKANRFASEAMSFLLMVVLVVSGILIAIMPWFMHILAPGFADNPDKFELTIALTRITMPYIIFISLVSLLGGMLNSSGKFAAMASMPIILNLCLIFIPLMAEGVTPTGAHSLAYAVTIAGVLQWLWMVYFCKRNGLLPHFVRPRLTPEVKKLLLLIAPVALGAGVAQINLVIDMIIASQFDSGVSYLYYADRINGLPLSVIGVALGTALLPMLSKQIREGHTEKAHQSQNRAIEFGMFLSIPAAAALMVIAHPVIATMFERGEFSATDTDATARALIAFSIGLPAFILVKILGPGFYANQDTKTPFKIATLCVVVNVLLSLALMGILRHVGMALATSITGWLNVVLMLTILQKRGWLNVTVECRKRLLRIIPPTLVMVVVLAMGRESLMSYMQSAEFARFSALIVCVMAGSACYFAVSIMCNTMDIRTRLMNRNKT
ncbi:MAG: murein biosynthesis integral membrane protein MurJ [Rickettsiales bacterium]